MLSVFAILGQRFGLHFMHRVGMYVQCRCVCRNIKHGRRLRKPACTQRRLFSYLFDPTKATDIPQTLLELMEHGVIIYSPTWSVAIKEVSQRRGREGGRYTCAGRGSTYVRGRDVYTVSFPFIHVWAYMDGPRQGLWKFAELADVRVRETVTLTGRRTHRQVEVPVDNNI